MHKCRSFVFQIVFVGISLKLFSCLFVGSPALSEELVEKKPTTLQDETVSISNSAKAGNGPFFEDPEGLQKAEICSQLSLQRCVSCCEDFFIAGSEKWDQCQVTCDELAYMNNLEY